MPELLEFTYASATGVRVRTGFCVGVVTVAVYGGDDIGVMVNVGVLVGVAVGDAVGVFVRVAVGIGVGVKVGVMVGGKV